MSDASHPSAAPETRAEIVSVGTELLLGEITDTNASWIAGHLPALGIPVYRIQQTGDNRARLTGLLTEAWTRADLLLLTGGLGPTEDDVTREAIADLLGEEMRLVPELEAHLRAFFAQRSRPMPERNLKQATLIASAEALPNPIGTAPGWWVTHERKYIAAMPGVPTEMRRMWREQVMPRLIALPRGGVIVKRTLKILGLGESAVEQDLGDLVRGTNPTVATYAKADGIHVRLAARSHDPAEAQRLVEATEAMIRSIFGQHIYGVDDEDLLTGTARLLAQQGRRPALAEAGLGGALCRALGSDGAMGGLMLPLEAGPEDDWGATARLLAERARDTFHAVTGLGAVLGERPSGVQEAAVALVTAKGVRIEHETYRTESSDAVRRAVLLAMRLLRVAEELP